jgi:hypothetical protein
MTRTHRDEKGTVKKSVPWVFQVAVVALINEEWQLIARYNYFAIA